jgi:hypothetical protein
MAKRKLDLEYENTDDDEPKFFLTYDFCGLDVSYCFDTAIPIVKKVIQSDKYRDIVEELVGKENFLNQQFNEAINNTYCLTPNRREDLVGCYCYVLDRKAKRKEIFFNWQLLGSIAFDKGCNLDNYILFVVIKLVHEISHHINYASSSIFIGANPENRMPPKIVTETYKRRNQANQIETVRNQNMYQDFGDLVEKALFGGLVEASGESFMTADSLVVYESQYTTFGKTIRVHESLERFKAGCFDLVAQDEHESLKLPGEWMANGIRATEYSHHDCDDDFYDPCGEVVV